MTTMDVLYQLAEPRAGYFTTSRAAEADISRQQLSYLAQAGSIDRVAQGIYRLRRFPAQRFEDVIVACLWAGDDTVASHDTALAIYGLTDAMPAQIHITVPRHFRGRRQGVVIVTAPIRSDERTERDGVPVTTVARTVVDVLKRSGAPLATEAAGQALARGLVTRRSLRAALERHGVSARSVLDTIGTPS